MVGGETRFVVHVCVCVLFVPWDISPGPPNGARPPRGIISILTHNGDILLHFTQCKLLILLETLNLPHTSNLLTIIQSFFTESLAREEREYVILYYSLRSYILDSPILFYKNSTGVIYFEFLNVGLRRLLRVRERDMCADRYI